MPHYKVVFVPLAEHDIQGIFEWYESKKENLGVEFIIELDSCIDKISTNPHIAFNVLKNVKRIAIHRFPYNLYYSIEKTTVYVFVIMHQFRNPEKWQLRIKL